MSRKAIGAALVIFLVCGEASASPATFTWDPAQAAPPVQGSAFTADAILTTDFLFNSGDAAGNGTDYFILQVNGFSKNGVAVPVPGLNSTYGLYIDLTIATVGSGYGAGTVALRLDPTNNDGTPSATWNAATQTGGVSFANPANTADDVTLATGTFLSGAFGLQSNGRVGARFLEGFVPNPAVSGFFASPNGVALNIDEMLFNTPTSRVQGPNNIGGLYTVVNGGFGTVTLQPVPEPATIALLGTTLLGLAGLRRKRRLRNSAGTMVALLALGGIPTAATAGTVFTWNPSGASPSLGGSAFTADAILGTHTLYDIAPIANPSPLMHTVDYIERITGFTLNGAPVATPGFNGTPGAAGSYGLYLTMQNQTQSVGLPNIFQYPSGQLSLMADPGNNDGAVSSTVSGLQFANTGPTGTADDITLATGSLISGHFTPSPAPGVLSIGNFQQTFQPASGEGGFFVTPVSPRAVIDLVLTTPVGALRFFPDPSDPSLQISTLNGGTAAIDLTVPEPSSLVLLSAALGSLLLIRRRRT